MSEYLLGIDNGNTISKAAIFDLAGREIQVTSRKADSEYPQPGWTERSMDELWQSTAMAVKDALSQSGIKPQQIIGVGTTGHGNGLYLIDKDGRPARAGIQSLDSRAAHIIDNWNRDGLHDQVFPFTTQAFWPAQPNALLAWIKQNEAQVYQRIGAVLMVKDYIKYCLTGEITSDFTDMSGTSLMDVRNKCYSEELLNFYDLADIRPALPTLVTSFEIAGRITPDAARATGLAAGTPVVGGLFDVDASALGAGVHQPGQVCIIAGTWSINEIVTSDPIVDPALFMTSIYTVPDLWLTIEASATSATNLEWFVTQFCAEEKTEADRRGISVYDVCSEMVDSLPPGGSDIIFHPFLFGSNVQASARAGFYGIAGWHTKAHMLRSLYEGVVYGHLSHFEKLRDAGSQVDVARLSGGGAHSSVWTQIFADTLQLPMEVPDGIEIGARGAALSAGIGVGVYKDHADAVATAVKIERRQEPNPAATPFYLERYAEYKKLLECMQEPWDRLSRLKQGEQSDSE
ncbi:Carbohydrate kinase, FGGY family [Olavius sp. associated proteobacterium Delta 1]|nr:Carbohydrate kinase, FGGY family [Olavius sp. associated proteobacterium Delta 1]